MSGFAFQRLIWIGRGSGSIADAPWLIALANRSPRMVVGVVMSLALYRLRTGSSMIAPSSAGCAPPKVPQPETCSAISIRQIPW
jgi:hypothetical protein